MDVDKRYQMWRSSGIGILRGIRQTYNKKDCDKRQMKLGVVAKRVVELVVVVYALRLFLEGC